jgi:pyruvoyl-dependent arginine decarboxylase
MMIVSGSGESNFSELNAFDAALVSCNIGHLNLIEYSSIIPCGISYLEEFKVTPGTQTGIILAKSCGNIGDVLSSGIAIAKLNDYSIVFEGHIIGSEKEIEENLVEMIKEACYIRGETPRDIFLSVNCNEVTKKFGCSISAIIFNPASYI